MDFRSRHYSDRRGMFVVLPVSFGPDHDDFSAEKFARLVVLLPVIGHKDFEDRSRGETFARGRGKTEQAAAGFRRNRTRKTGLEKGRRAEREKALRVWPAHLSIRLLEGYRVTSAPNHFVVVRP